MSYLSQHARRDARTDDAGRLITLDRQDRSRWHGSEIAEGVAIPTQVSSATPNWLAAKVTVEGEA